MKHKPRRVDQSSHYGLLALAATLVLTTALPASVLAQQYSPYQPRGVVPNMGFPNTTPSPMPYGSGAPTVPGYMPPAYGAPSIPPALDYATLYQQGNELYQQGRMSEALAAYEKALPLAQGESIPIVYNNLAAIHMKRGNYFLGQKDIGKALTDFRMAVFYLDVGWPLGLDYSDSQRANRQIAKQNLTLGYQQAHLAAKATAHAQTAADLRRQGHFPEAATEYAQVLGANPSADVKADSLRALGDLFLVLNRPQTAKKYYRELVAAQPQVDTDVKLRLANAEYQSGEVDAAIARLSEITDADPKNMAALRQLEQVWQTERKYSPNNPLVHANLASIFQKEGQLQKALSAYTNAEQLAARTPTFDRAAAYELRLNLGTLHQEMNNNRAAEQAYQSVLAEIPTHERGLLLLALLYKQENRPREAQQALEQLVAAHPEATAAHDELLAMIQQDPDKDRQVSSLKAYGQRFPTTLGVQQAVAEAIHAAGQPQEAVPFYQQAVQLSSNNATGLSSQERAALLANAATALQATGQSQTALQYLAQAKQLDPANATVQQLAQETQQNVWQGLYHQAAQAQQANQPMQAIGLYKQAIAAAQQASITPPGELYADYGLALQNNGQVAEAIAQYTTALTRQPTQGDWLYYRATAYHQSNQAAKAQADYTAALQDANLDEGYRKQAQEGLDLLAQAQVNGLLQQAMAAYQKKQYPQALQILTKAEQEDPQNAFVAYYQGLIYDDQRKTSDAMAAYQRAISRDNTFADAYYGLAVAQDTSGKAAEALKSYQQYLQAVTDRTSETAKYAQTRVAELQKG